MWISLAKNIYSCESSFEVLIAQSAVLETDLVMAVTKNNFNFLN